MNIPWYGVFLTWIKSKWPVIQFKSFIRFQIFHNVSRFHNMKYQWICPRESIQYHRINKFQNYTDHNYISRNMLIGCHQEQNRNPNAWVMSKFFHSCIFGSCFCYKRYPFSKKYLCYFFDHIFQILPIQEHDIPKIHQIFWLCPWFIQYYMWLCQEITKGNIQISIVWGFQMMNPLIWMNLGIFEIR